MTATGLVWYWLALATLFAGGATYVLCVWWAIRGVRGLALATAMVSLFVIASAFAGLHSRQSMIPPPILAAVERAAWWPLLLSLLVIIDFYASSSNSHRALTTILYLRYQRLIERERAGKH